MINNASVPAISIIEVSKKYPKKGVQALQNINLDIPEGEFFALLGANGAGKTTLINILTDLVTKSSGKVLIKGVDIDKDFVTAKTYLGVVPQEFNFGMFDTCLDICVTQAGYYGISRDIAVPRATQILTDLGLKDKLKSVSRTLSGGMKRRLMIARSLMHSPQILILDEPTAGVDVQLRMGMWEYLQKINQENGVTILLTTHYLEEVEALCSRAAIIKDGQIVRLDTVKNLIQSLDKESYIIDIEPTTHIESAIKNTDKFILTKIDGTSLEVEIKTTQTINALIEYLTTQKIIVKGLRPKENRLETLFINTLKNPTTNLKEKLN